MNACMRMENTENNFHMEFKTENRKCFKINVSVKYSDLKLH